MSLALDRSAATPAATPVATTSLRATALSTAGLASLGAGVIHAAAIGVHAEHAATARTFTVLAALQISWGVWALLRSNRAIAVLGVVLGFGAFAGWVLAKTSGISFIDGLETAEPIQWTDGLCAALALGSGVLSAVALKPKREGASAVPGLPLSLVAIAVAVVSLTGMVAASSHSHAHGEGELATGDHAHGDDHSNAASAGAMDHDNAPMDHGNEASGSEHAHGAPAVAPQPYTATEPVNLGGVPGVTPAQQQFAEATVTRTLDGLSQWTYDGALAKGFFSIGDQATGTEHLINQTFMDNPTILDPNEPESLVFDVDRKTGTKTLSAAMYMMQTGTPLENVPKDGGSLMQWHIHNNLCFNAAGKVAGLTNAQGQCPAPLIKPPNTPMIHVWIRPNPCGPFAALEGIGAGQIAAGETRLCDEAHGAEHGGAATPPAPATPTNASAK